MTPAAGIEALKMAAGLTMTVFKIVQEERARLPNGPDRDTVEAAIAEALDVLAELMLYEPKQPTPMPHLMPPYWICRGCNVAFTTLMIQCPNCKNPDQIVKVEK